MTFHSVFPLKMWAFWSRFSRRCTFLNSCHLQCLIIFLDSEKHFWVNHYMKRVFDPQKTSRSTHGSCDHQQEISQLENWQLRQKLVTTSQTAFVADTRSLSRNSICIATKNWELEATPWPKSLKLLDETAFVVANTRSLKRNMPLH